MAMAHGFEYDHNDYTFRDIKYHSNENVTNSLTKCYLNIMEYLNNNIDEDELNNRLNENIIGLSSDEIDYINDDINRTLQKRFNKNR